MRINTVFSKKVSTAQYENEVFTVTMEAESEFNSIAEVADYLFNQARSAVERQICGKAAAATPETTIPPNGEAKAQDHQETPKPAANGNGQPITDKQKNMIFKLLRDCFESRTQEQAYLKEAVGVERVDALSRKQASRVIESLMDRQRNAA